MTLLGRKLSSAFVEIGFMIFIAGSQFALADSFILTPFPQDPGATSTTPQGMNNSGSIVGSSSLGGFIYKNGSFTPFSDPGATSTNPYGISNNGLIVGVSSSGAFLYNGTFTPLTFAGHTTTPRAVNDSGVVVGFDGNGFWYDGTNFTFIPIPGALFTEAYGINDLGQIVGIYGTGTKTDGFVYDIYTAAFQDIAVPGALSSQVYGINNLGDLAGAYSDSSGFHGFVYADGAFSTVDAPSAPGGGGNTFVTSINDSRQILVSGPQGAYIGTPVPEPWSLGLLGTGMTIVAGIVRSRAPRSERKEHDVDPTS
jgi:hypothetical protein